MEGEIYLPETTAEQRKKGTYPDIDTAEECQLKCQAHERCNWFNWRSTSYPKGCWLLTTKGRTRLRIYTDHLSATGPKTCSKLMGIT